MKPVKSIFNFYLDSSIHVSLAVLAFTLATLYEFNFALEKSLLGFIFFATITGYNFVKYAGIAGLHHRSLAKNLKLIQLFSLLSFGFFLFYLFQVSKPVIVTSTILGVLTLLYVVPFYNQKNLRNLYGLKVFIVALVWAGVTVLLPWVHFEPTFSADIWISFLQRFLWVLVLIIPFEIRDLQYDSVSLGTLPQKFGIQKSKKLGYFLLAHILLLEGFKDDISSEFLFSLTVMLMITGIFVKLSRKNQPAIYTSFWVEGIPIYWACFLMILKNYFFIS